MATAANRRQFQDVFEYVATGHATSAGTAISSGAQQALAVSIPTIVEDGTWAVLAVLPGAAGLSGCTATGEVTAAGVVTVYIQNLTGSSQTPAAQNITVIAARVDPRYTQL